VENDSRNVTGSRLGLFKFLFQLSFIMNSENEENPVNINPLKPTGHVMHQKV
jgi:hypothetical protein